MILALNLLATVAYLIAARTMDQKALADHVAATA